MKKIILTVLPVIYLLFFFNLTASAQYNGKHEWRAVWIATVNNIDWPSRPGLTSQQQQQELIEYFDLFKKMNFNAIVLQVRPAADAFYISDNEPWSIYLTGDQSKAPDPLYDPLAFAVTEAHKRGMELHAWLNPYRASLDISSLNQLAESHLYRKNPGLFQVHGKKLYFDPAYPETREFLAGVIKDIVTRYDVDGIHFDDYFYPDRNFDDTASFKKHSRGYKPEDKMAWRRENVDLVVKMLRDTIKSVKPHVKFGISPYAVWRNLRDDPRGSDTRSFNYTNYDHLHADILLWMEKGWVDYILPQLYFNIGYKNADFNVLFKWWQDNSAGVPLYGGLGTYRLDRKSKIHAWRSSDEIKKQADIIRKSTEYQGVCYFNAKNMKDNRLGINSVLASLYSNPALVPPLRGFSTSAPPVPLKADITINNSVMNFTWEDQAPADGAGDSLPVYYHVIYKFRKGQKPDFTRGDAIVALTGEDNFTLPAELNSKYVFYLTSLDRLYNESKPVRFEVLR
jgi:uncharacterized lipoprotein YddW (UPF0748 family)